MILIKRRRRADHWNLICVLSRDQSEKTGREKERENDNGLGKIYLPGMLKDKMRNITFFQAYLSRTTIMN